MRNGRYIEYLQSGADVFVLELRVGNVEGMGHHQGMGNKWLMPEDWEELYDILDKVVSEHLLTRRMQTEAQTLIGKHVQVTYRFKPTLAGYQLILSPFQCDSADLSLAVAEPAPGWQKAKTHGSMLVAAVVRSHDHHNSSEDLFADSGDEASGHCSSTPSISENGNSLLVDNEVPWFDSQYDWQSSKPSWSQVRDATSLATRVEQSNMLSVPKQLHCDRKVADALDSHFNSTCTLQPSSSPFRELLTPPPLSQDSTRLSFHHRSPSSLGIPAPQSPEKNCDSGSVSSSLKKLFDCNSVIDQTSNDPDVDDSDAKSETTEDWDSGSDAVHKPFELYSKSRVLLPFQKHFIPNATQGLVDSFAELDRTPTSMPLAMVNVNRSSSQELMYDATRKLRSAHHKYDDLLSAEAASSSPCTQTELDLQFMLPARRLTKPESTHASETITSRRYNYSSKDTDSESDDSCDQDGASHLTKKLVTPVSSVFQCCKDDVNLYVKEQARPSHNAAPKKRKRWNSAQSDIIIAENTKNETSKPARNAKKKPSTSVKHEKLIFKYFAPKLNKTSTFRPEEICDLTEDDESTATQCITVSMEGDSLLAQRHFLRTLSLDFIDKAFNKHASFIHSIAKNRRPCLRHDQYHKDSRTRTELRDAPALSQVPRDILFHLLTRMINTFCKNNPLQLQDYMWKVSLPELINKIFMEKYNLSHKESEERLTEVSLLEAPGDEAEAE